MKNTWVPVKGYYTCKRQNLFKMWAVKLKDLKDESEACGKPCQEGKGSIQALSWKTLEVLQPVSEQGKKELEMKLER